jgi:HEPN domain-containing protein
MKESTARWLKKSDGNFHSMKTLLSLNDESVYDDVCALAQQTIEKLLKAICVEKSIQFPHTHDLRKLLYLLLEHFPSLRPLDQDLDDLTRLGGDFRYPDDFATKFEATKAAELAASIRAELKEILGPTEGMLFP